VTQPNGTKRLSSGYEKPGDGKNLGEMPECGRLNLPEGTKPDFKSDVPIEQLEFLDTLRETGVVNMFGAVPWLMDEFSDLTKHRARQVLTYWMQTFSERHPSGRSYSDIARDGMNE
jgi:hypothetical protein